MLRGAKLGCDMQGQCCAESHGVRSALVQQNCHGSSRNVLQDVPDCCQKDVRVPPRCNTLQSTLPQSASVPITPLCKCVCHLRCADAVQGADASARAEAAAKCAGRTCQCNQASSLLLERLCTQCAGRALFGVVRIAPVCSGVLNTVVRAGCVIFGPQELSTTEHRSAAACQPTRFGTARFSKIWRVTAGVEKKKNGSEPKLTRR